MAGRRATARTLLRVVIPWVVLLVALGAAVGSVVEKWDDIVQAAQTIGGGRLAIAAVLGILGVAVTAEVWRCSVVAATRPIPRLLPYRVFWVSQAGKYVPGAVWPFLVQSLAARRLGLQARGVLYGGAVFLAVHATTGLLLSSIGVALIPGAGLLLRLGVWATTAGAVLVLATGVWRQLPRLIGRSALPALALPAVARAAGWMVLAWCFYGGSTALLLAPLTGTSSAASFFPGVSAAAIGWLIGLLVVVAPGGAGARELAMAWVLGSVLSGKDLLAVVLLTRVVLLVGDLGLALTGVGVLRTLRWAPEQEREPAPAPAER